MTRAQSKIVELLMPDRMVDEQPLTEGQLTELEHALAGDAAFREAFDADPVAAAEAAGWPALARALERELRSLVALAERVAADDSFRAELGSDPRGTLVAAGIPTAGAEPLLRALGVPESALAGQDVVAHRHEQLPSTQRLTILLLHNSAVVERLRNAAH